MKLKQLLFLVALLAVILGCNSKPKSTFKEIDYRSKIFIEQKLISYINKNPMLFIEDSLRFTVELDKFQREAKAWSNDMDFLVDFPLQATNIRDTVMGGQTFKMATFEAYTDMLRDKESLLNQMKLRINGIFQFDEQAAGLVLGGKYYLKAIIYKQGKRADINLYKKENGPIYVLGVYPMSVEELKPVHPQEKIAKIN